MGFAKIRAYWLFFFFRSIFFPLPLFFISSLMLILSSFFRVELRKGGKRGKVNLQRVVSQYSETGKEFFTKRILGFLGITISGLVRISKTRYRWKDLSLLTFLFIILIA